MKKALLIIVSVITILAIPATIFLVKKQQDVRSKAAPATTLSLKPAVQTVKVGDTVTLEGTIDTGENQVYVAELHISYDPAKFEAISITNGPAFPNILISGKIDPTGNITITLGSANQQTPVTGTGVAATVKFKAIAETTSPTTVQFIEASTFVGAKEEGATNVLVGTVPSKISIGAATDSAELASSGNGATASPTPTSGDTATPTPTIKGATATPTPTGIPEDTSSELTITFPTQNISLTSTNPIFKGTAPKNASVTLTIYPSNQTVTVTANASGIWSYQPTQALETGPQELTATSVSAESGQPLTATRSFVIASTTGEGTENGTPVSGSAIPTVLLILLGSSLIAGGILLPNRVR